MISVGIDWAEAPHDVWLLDAYGEMLATRQIPKGSRAWSGCTRAWASMPTSARR